VYLRDLCDSLLADTSRRTWNGTEGSHDLCVPVTNRDVPIASRCAKKCSVSRTEEKDGGQFHNEFGILRSMRLPGFRYSLRTLFVVMTILAIVLAWVGTRYHAVAQDSST